MLNEVHPAPVPDAAFYRAWRESLLAGADAAGQEALHLVDLALERVAAQDHARGRLAALGAPVTEVPFLFRRDLGVADLDALLPAVGSL